MMEREGNTLALDGLSTYTNRHLGDVDVGAFGTCDYHLLDVVVLLQDLLSVLARGITSLVEMTLDRPLESLGNRHTGLQEHEVPRRKELKKGIPEVINLQPSRSHSTQ